MSVRSRLLRMNLRHSSLQNKYDAHPIGSRSFALRSGSAGKRERTDIPPAHEHVDRLIGVNGSDCDWSRVLIGRERMPNCADTYIL